LAALEPPLVVLLEQHGADEADHGGFVREHADDVAAALDLGVEALQRGRAVDLSPAASASETEDAAQSGMAPASAAIFFMKTCGAFAP
jgi:hypothetical protein